ncbi:MAG: acyltransferase [Desulfobacula sp.]|jgi:1-acyl-sn-glycerol-3-phosphate acyltransferase|uniref:acyltransferase n=1 Tax=Desulfobacula sp. TaxID=2593537 RepID=UPI001DA07BF8|nr:acyltransferase [Desulfobacula sp.]MBT3484308.1 acyltransferase [Desulfobacula sp.]MBT3805019.1 acyltransferase [Desulfobacula sp.]MBT4024103.1 acyltransferase [Desulfobacula sp.]MBT4197427.1 acyltransferase [Desulfobacula sp.]
MLYFLPPSLKGILSILLYTLNTISLTIPLILISFFKFIIPVREFVVILDRILISIATLWIGINSFNSRLFCNIEWDIRGLEKLEKKEWYLIISNHQSWVDILALQTILNKKIPMLKFFLKKELIWVPFLGLAWWALDFPYMKRYSKKLLKQKPHLRGKDLESTKKACKKFKHTPVSIMNFVEGTRFTPYKKESQNNHLTHLLNPKAGGIAFVLGSMGEYLHKIIDVTIVYPDKTPTFWEYISGRTHKIIIDFQVIPVTDSLTGDYFNDLEYKNRFFIWLKELWRKKDEKIKILKS